LGRIGGQELEGGVPDFAGGGKVVFGLKRVRFGGKLVEFFPVDKGVALRAGQNPERQAGSAVGTFFRLRRNQ